MYKKKKKEIEKPLMTLEEKYKFLEDTEDLTLDDVMMYCQKFPELLQYEVNKYSADK
jgi:hypothetical protein